MIISHTNKFIFIKSEKTGGSSVETALEPSLTFSDVYHKNGHEIPAQILQKYGSKIFNNYFKFSIVRNPFDKMVSHYFWQRYLQPERYDSFHDFVKEFYYNKIISNWKYFSINNNVVIDRILKYEDLQKDLHSISSNISIDIDISGIFEKSGYRPPDVPYQEYYSDTIKEMVEELCIQEISLFNYSF
jgi:hypothetical protein